MSKTKNQRDKKQQLGQFMTPFDLSNKIINKITFKITDKILEPSMGDGSFIIAIIRKIINDVYDNSTDFQTTINEILINNIWGVEFDEILYHQTLNNIESTFGIKIHEHNFILSDFFKWDSDIKFNYVIGNPPFGGTIDSSLHNIVEKKYGKRFNIKIKKETYSMFMVKSHEHLDDGGVIIFISSDTFLTIKTMKGLRNFLFNTGFVNILKLKYFSEETDYGMVVMFYKKDKIKDYIVINKSKINKELINLTDNLSWSINEKYAKYFRKNKLSKYITTSSGMTVGKNELFLKNIDSNNKIIEKYNYSYFKDTITLDNEINKAKNNLISDNKKEIIKKQELNGETVRNLKVIELETPITIQLPNPDYCYYNKATSDIIYSKPNTVIYWKDDGDAVYTFKKNGNWYLHGIGGKPFFKMEGITWRLISNKILMRYLEPGYILDSGSPIGVLKKGVDKDELFFILAWTLSDLCNDILKKVINHTTNIQSKDVERLPYPYWVKDDDKKMIVSLIKKHIRDIKNNIDINTESLLNILNSVFNY